MPDETPDSMITVKGDRVVRYELWAPWKGTSTQLVLITRTEDGFHATVLRDPKHGKLVCTADTIAAAASQLDTDTLSRLIELFALPRPSLRPIQSLFPGHSVAFYK